MCEIINVGSDWIGLDRKRKWITAPGDCITQFAMPRCYVNRASVAVPARMRCSLFVASWLWVKKKIGETGRWTFFDTLGTTDWPTDNQVCVKVAPISWINFCVFPRVLVFPPVSNFRRFLIHKLVEESFPTLKTFSVGEDDARRTVVCFLSDYQLWVSFYSDVIEVLALLPLSEITRLHRNRLGRRSDRGLCPVWEFTDRQPLGSLQKMWHILRLPLFPHRFLIKKFQSLWTRSFLRHPCRIPR